ncbi:MAG: hypothetical protein ACPGTQ_02695 [Colwellia sp.]
MKTPNAFKALLFITFCLTSHFTLAKERCKPLLEKVHKIQKSQRHGYSLKQGDSLREKEDKARKAWWNCETSTKKYRKVTKKNKYEKNRKKQRKNRKYKATKPVKTAKKQTKKRLSKKPVKLKTNNNVNKEKLGRQIASSNKISTAILLTKHYEEINFLADYKEEKLIAWQTFYQIPAGCLKPKNLSLFVACSEKKKEMKGVFERQWRKLQGSLLVSESLEGKK